MNCSLQKNLVTNITFEWFVRIVDRSSVFWQIALLRKTLVTNITFEQFLSLFMYFRNMFFHSLFLRAVKEQTLNEKFTQIWYKELSLQKIISLYDPGNFIGQVVRAYLNTIWMTLCTPRCKSTTSGCYFYVFLLMVRNSTLIKRCFFYDSFFWCYCDMVRISPSITLPRSGSQWPFDQA